MLCSEVLVFTNIIIIYLYLEFVDFNMICKRSIKRVLFRGLLLLIAVFLFEAGINISAGTILNAQDCPVLGLNFGDSCDDNDSATSFDIIQSDCTCLGALVDCEGTPGGSAVPGIPCDDNDPNTNNDAFQDDCTCIGQLIIVCPDLGLNVGEPCNDNNPNTNTDVIQSDCICAGEAEPCPDDGTCNTNCENGDLETWNPTICDCEVTTVVVFGCTNNAATNFDANANCDDNSCEFSCPDPGNCDDGDCSNGNEAWNIVTCECVSINAPDPSSCVDDGDCSNGFETWNADDCQCEGLQPTEGCTNPSAENYDPSANCDDGSCIIGSGIEDIQVNDLQIRYDHNGQVYISIDESHQSDEVKFSIFSISGKLVQHRELSEEEWSPSSTLLPSGIYIIQVGRVAKRFMMR